MTLEQQFTFPVGQMYTLWSRSGIFSLRLKYAGFRNPQNSNKQVAKSSFCTENIFPTLQFYVKKLFTSHDELYLSLI